MRAFTVIKNEIYVVAAAVGRGLCIYLLLTTIFICLLAVVEKLKKEKQRRQKISLSHDDIFQFVCFEFFFSLVLVNHKNHYKTVEL